MSDNIKLSEKLMKLIDVAIQALEKYVYAPSNTQVIT